jgi:hypothetical protein
MDDIVMCYYYDSGGAIITVHRRHFTTLLAIYRVPPTMWWAEIESLLKAVGQVTEREGSRIVAMANGISAVFHRPHPPQKHDDS